MIEILSSRIYYKNPNGGVTKRIDEHFWKRKVRYLKNGKEESIEITKDALGLYMTEEELKQFIASQ